MPAPTYLCTRCYRYVPEKKAHAGADEHYYRWAWRWVLPLMLCTFLHSPKYRLLTGNPPRFPYWLPKSRPRPTERSLHRHDVIGGARIARTRTFYWTLVLFRNMAANSSRSLGRQVLTWPRSSLFSAHPLILAALRGFWGEWDEPLSEKLWTPACSSKDIYYLQLPAQMESITNSYLHDLPISLTRYHCTWNHFFH